jgi:hypothetical protein
LGFPDFKLSPKYGFAPMGQLRRFGPNKQNQKIDGSDFG